MARAPRRRAAAAAPRPRGGLRRVRDAARAARRAALPAPRRRRSPTSPPCASARSSSPATRPRRRRAARARAAPRAAAHRDDAARRCSWRTCRRRRRAARRPADAPDAALEPDRPRAGRGPRRPVHDRRRRRRLRLRQRAPAPRARAARLPHRPQRRSRTATFQAFVEGGGYAAPRMVDATRAGRGRRSTTSQRPAGWTADGREWRMDRCEPLDPRKPVVHVSWFEADAFARAHGARLPTEAEWEKAATWDQQTQTARPPAVGRRPPTPTRSPRARTSTSAPSAPRRRAPTPTAPRPPAASAWSATCGSGPRAASTAIPASPPTPTASTPRSSSAATTACCAAARGRRARASRRRPSATGTTRSGARSSPALRIAKDA